MSGTKKTDSTKKTTWSARETVLGILGVITLGVAGLSVFVSYQILHPRFGTWSVPTVGALDALWVVFQATEILSGNNSRRARRVRYAGLALTAVIAAIPTTDLILSGHGRVDLAVVLTPIAIVATKATWWLALPSLGRTVSEATRKRLDVKRQQVRDRLEEMEAEAAHRVELLGLATALEEQVAKAETKYRLSTLKRQQTTNEELHAQAAATAKTLADKALPESARITLPQLDTWEPVTPALPGGEAVTEPVTQVSSSDDDTSEEPSHTSSRDERLLVTVAEIASVTGVPTPVTGEALTDGQITVLLRALRYSEDPPLSYRQASSEFRRLGYVASEGRVRPLWRQLRNKETQESSQEAPRARVPEGEEEDGEDEVEEPRRAR